MIKSFLLFITYPLWIIPYKIRKSGENFYREIVIGSFSDFLDTIIDEGFDNELEKRLDKMSDKEIKSLLFDDYQKIKVKYNELIIENRVLRNKIGVNE